MTKVKFLGSYELLRHLVAETKVLGVWDTSGPVGNGVRFRTAYGAVLNYWPTTGTLTLQGKRREEFALALGEALKRHQRIRPREHRTHAAGGRPLLEPPRSKSEGKTLGYLADKR